MKALVDYSSLIKNSNTNLLKGTDGFCFIKDKLMYKIYFVPKNNINFYDFSKYKSDLIAFPLYYLYDYKKFPQEIIVGEVMPYYKKETIWKSIRESTDVNNLIRNYSLIVCEMNKFPKVNMNDLSSPNILYDDKNGFSLIDTYDWIINESANYVELNKRYFDYALSNLLLDNLLELHPIVIDDYNFCHNLIKFGKDGINLLKAIQSTFEDDYQFVEILELYRLVFEKAGFEPIKTIDDMQKYTKKLKKG